MSGKISCAERRRKIDVKREQCQVPAPARPHKRGVQIGVGDQIPRVSPSTLRSSTCLSSMRVQ